MKNFFKDLFSKKYPERARKDDKAMKRVYAGPAQMKCVYAGPDMMGKLNPRTGKVYMGPPTEDEPVCEDVYAGPPADDEPVDDKPAIDKQITAEVYAGPSSNLQPNIMEAMMVYAGPEQMNSNGKILGGMFVMDNNSPFAAMYREGKYPTDGTGENGDSEKKTDGSGSDGSESMV